MGLIRRIAQTITVHISPYLAGLAPETYPFVDYLNDEAARHGRTVQFRATGNRIEASIEFPGSLKREAKCATLGGLLLRDAFAAGYIAFQKRRAWWTRRELDRQTDLEIEAEEPVLRRGNSLHRRKLYKLEKNRGLALEKLLPWAGEKLSDADLKELIRWARAGEAIFSPSEWARLKLKLAAETLFHLIEAIPFAERDQGEIYPDDFRYPQVPLWREEKMRWPGLGLRTYSEPVLLLLKSGKHERDYRQKAASPVWHIPITPELTAIYSWLWQQLSPSQTQRLLERIDRLYKGGCHRPQLGPRCLFDRGSKGHGTKELVPLVDPKKQEVVAAAVADIVTADPKTINRDIAHDLKVSLYTVRAARQQATGGRVIYLEPPSKRYAALAADRDSYNERWGSYLNGAGLSRFHRQWRSLNIPRETIEVRDNMVANLERDFNRLGAEQKVA